MSDNNGSELGAFLAGFVIGGLVGAATALILAPRSGAETRMQIANKSHELRQAGEDRVESMRGSALDYAAQMQEQVHHAGEVVAEQTRIVLDTGKEQASRLRQIGEDITTDPAAPDPGDAPAAE